MSLSADLVVTALEDLVARTGAVEQEGAGGGPLLPLRASDGTDAGVLRVYSSPLVSRVVYVNLRSSEHQLDSHMFYAFAPADSGVPHLTLDAAVSPAAHAFHADLMQRVDLATHVAYMDAVYGPLQKVVDEVAADERFLAAVVPTRGRAMMSPWMLANRLAPEDFGAAAEPCRAFVDHWLDLSTEGLPAEVVATLDDTDLAARDRALRHGLFGGDIDPSWNLAAMLVGAEAVQVIRDQLQGL